MAYYGSQQQVVDLQRTADDIAELLAHKESTYKGSWIKRGGVGAYMMMARKWDRIENFAKEHGYDIFAAINDYDGKEEGPLQDITDLLGYLLLVKNDVDRRKRVPYGLDNKPTIPSQHSPRFKPLTDPPLVAMVSERTLTFADKVDQMGTDAVFKPEPTVSDTDLEDTDCLSEDDGTLYKDKEVCPVCRGFGEVMIRNTKTKREHGEADNIVVDCKCCGGSGHKPAWYDPSHPAMDPATASVYVPGSTSDPIAQPLKDLNLPTKQPCPSCNADGSNDIVGKCECNTCGNQGWITKQEMT